MTLIELIEAIEVEWALATMMPAAFSRQSLDKLYLLASRAKSDPTMAN
jgi:hypothetical protein